MTEPINRRPESIPELVDYTSTQLLDELLSRFDAGVFCGVLTRSASSKVYHRRYCGNSLTCSSLADYMRIVTMNDFIGECEEAEE